jgi:hypothetical protein
MLLNFLWVKTCWIINGSISFDNADNLCSFLMHLFGEMETNITKTLNDNLFAFNTMGKISLIKE